MTKLSSPTKNTLLWRLLNEKQMYNLITAKAESSNANSNSIKEHLLKNCENDQINRMLDLCDPNQRLALQKNIIGLRYGQPSSIELPHFDDILTSFKVERPQPPL